MADRNSEPDPAGNAPDQDDDVGEVDEVGDIDDDVDVDQIPDRVDQQELESFPASDPHSDWSGPPS